MTEPQQTTPIPAPQRASAWVRLLSRPVSLKFAMLAVLVALVAPAAIPIYRILRTVFDWEHVEKATLAILKGENLAFLVTDRLVSQIVVEVSDSSALLGKREGILIGTVTLYYGINAQALDSSCLSRVGKRMIVRLPEPRELDFAVDPSSFRYITKRSGWNVVVDYVRNRDIEAELRQDIHRHALAFFSEKKMIPTRAKIVAQLNDLAAPFSKELGVPIEFR